MLKFIRKSLQAKVILITLLLGMLIGVLALWSNYLWQKQAMIVEIHASASQKADLLKMGIEKPMTTGDDDGTIDQFNTIAKRNPKIQILLASFLGKVTYSTQRDYLWRDIFALPELDEVKELLRQSVAEPIEQGEVIRLGGREHFIEIISVENRPQCRHCHGWQQPILGTMVMMQDIGAEMSFLRRGQIKSALLSLAGLALLLLILTSFMNASVLRRIKNLTRATQRVRSGDLEVDFQIKGRDELTQLGSDIGHMVYQIKDQLEYTKGIINAIQAGITVIDSTTKTIVDVNPVAARIIGRKPEELVGRDYCEFIRFKDETVCPPETFKACDTIKETVLITPKGSEVPVLKNQVFIRSEEQRHIIYSFIDITERKEHEEVIRKAHEEKEQLLASISSILIGIDEQGGINQWNTTAEQVFDLPAEKVLGTSFRSCPISWNWEKVNQALKECGQSNSTITIDSLGFKNKDGRLGVLSMHINPVKCEPGEDCRMLILADDITELKVLEEQLLQSKKLESLGQLSAGIAHEINTPTQYVGDNTRFLEEAFQDLKGLIEIYEDLLNKVRESIGEEDLRILQEAEEEADLEYLEEEIPRAIVQSLDGIDRIKKIVLSMKQFSHPGAKEKMDSDLNTALQSTITISRNEWKYLADVVTDLDPELSMVSCYPDELNQVFLNIIINAAHAIGEKVAGSEGERGTITVATRQREGFAEVRISDTGGGIPAKIQEHIFDPFFTTKQVGKGTGQGLNIAHAVVVEKHGGTLTFETEEGKGTTFIITLPQECPAPGEVLE